MAKGGFGKFLAGVAVIGAGVALGLTIYNHVDKIKRELNVDEFEDEFDDEDDDNITSSADKAYVKINAGDATDADAEDTDTTDDIEADSIDIDPEEIASDDVTTEE